MAMGAVSTVLAGHPLCLTMPREGGSASRCLQAHARRPQCQRPAVQVSVHQTIPIAADELFK